jgi:hypothetical protein
MWECDYIVEWKYNKDDLQGPLKGKDSDLISLMRNSSTYVNVHTEEYKDGAIRGQIG